MKKVRKLIALSLASFLAFITVSIGAFADDDSEVTYLEPVISTNEAVQVGKSNIFDASQSFIPEDTGEIEYNWDFGDGNSNEGIEVLHSYKEAGRYTVTLTLNTENEVVQKTKEIFAYNKLLLMLTDQADDRFRIENFSSYGESEGVFTQIVDSYGATTEFISEEVLAKKLTEQSASLQNAQEIVIWTKENAGLNALSRFVQSNSKEKQANLKQKNIIIINNNISASKNRIQKQFKLIQPKEIILAKEAAIYPLIESSTEEEFIQTLEIGGYEYAIVNEKSGQIRPWNFMSYFVNFLVGNGIPDNTIALLLLLPVIATVVTVMKQVVGVTTFGIYTPSIITLSFLVIGLEAGLITLVTAIFIGAISRPLLNRFRILFIPKMAIVITIVALALFLILILSTYIGLFNAEFLSIAIFPMLILSTLVEKFISVKTEKGLSSATVLMAETVFVSIIAYVIAGGEINLGFTSFRIDLVKNLMLSYPEVILLLIVANVLLGKWSGVRLLELVRFREVLRHLEE